MTATKKLKNSPQLKNVKSGNGNYETCGNVGDWTVDDEELVRFLGSLESIVEELRRLNDNIERGFDEIEDRLAEE